MTARINLGKVFRADSPNFFLLLGLTVFLVIIGLLMVLSASSVDSFLQSGQFFGAFGRQLMFAAIGLPAMMVVSQLPRVFWSKWALAILIAGSAFQLLVFTPLGYESGGNRNWITIGGLTAQPSEFLKLALAIWLGVALPVAIRRNGAHSPKVLLTLVPAAVPIGLVLIGGDLGTVIIMGMIVIAALFFAGISFRVLAIPVVLGAGAVGLMAVTSPNRMARIFSFLSENCTDYANACWQPLHGKWALAGGGIFGVGPGNSKAKWSWLPAADNDYIFAIIGEELGLIGAVLVLILFVLMAVAFIRVIKETTDSMVRITTGAIMIWIVGQAFVNIGVVLGVFPVLGVPLPLLSSGGTALIAALLAIGVVLSFTRASNREPQR
jgi:cell division protein FtsW